MGNNIQPEQVKMVQEHIERQERLVSNLRAVCEQQARALASLHANDDDYNEADEKEAAHHDESGGEEFNKLWELAANCEARGDRGDWNNADEDGIADYQYTEPTEDEERNFMAVKPWLGAMAPPSDWNKNPAWDEEPAVKLTLEHVYGYRARLCRNNAYWVDADRIVYHAAGVGIVHNLANNTQRFFFGHDDDIVALDFHKGSMRVVTGQQGKSPKTCVWDVNTCQQISCFEGYHRRAVVAVAFCVDGSKVASVGSDDNNSVAVSDTLTGQLVVESKGDTNKILSIGWNTTKVADGNNDFVTVGEKHIKFWSIAGGSLTSQKGLLGKKGEISTYLEVAFTPERTLIATKGGEIFPFNGNKLQNPVAAHGGMVYCLRTDNTAGLVYTGGKDGCLNIWDLNMKKLNSINFNKRDPALLGKNFVRSIHMLPGSQQLLVGCNNSSLYKVNSQSGQVDTITSGHFGDMQSEEYGELWGLSPHPTKPQVASAAQDGTLRIWDVPTRKLIQRVDLGTAANCCGWSPDGKQITVGLADGGFTVVETQQWQQLLSKRKARRRITCVKYSPDGRFLAVGSADNRIQFYDVATEMGFIGQSDGSSSVILGIDWSEDSKYTQCATQAYELLFYEVTKTAVTLVTKSRELRDIKWATQSITLGWTVQGIWPKYSDGSDINNLNRSNSQKYLVSAEDSGTVRLFNYPCIGSGLDKEGALARRPKSFGGHAHSSHVTNVAWLFNDAYVISAGGADLTVMQWKVEAV